MSSHPNPLRYFGYVGLFFGLWIGVAVVVWFSAVPFVGELPAL